MSDNFNFAQVQPFSLAGAGCSMGATSITLNSMLQIDGVTPLTMASFGIKGFATIEPGNGTREEQIVFTGIVQNANGTATLTGVSNVTFIAPYTQTSGAALSHPGGVKLIISNTAGFYNELTSKDDDEIINGDWTFTAIAPTIPTQTSVEIHRAASIEYVNNTAFAGAPNASTTVKGISQEATQSDINAATEVGTTGAELFTNPATLKTSNYGTKVFQRYGDYAADAGSTDDYVITLTPVPTAYTAGMFIQFKPNTINTGACTINVNSLGAKGIKKGGTTDPANGDLAAGQVYSLVYDGTNFQMVDAGVNVPPVTGNTNKFITTTDGVNLSFGTVYDFQEFTSSGTWTKPSNLVGTELVIVQAWGQGGGGGGTNGGGGNAGGGGGGGGSFFSVNFKASQLTSTVTVTVGNNTNGGVATVGGVGANTTFGTFLTVYGGGGGSTGSNNASQGGGGGAGVLAVGSVGTGSVGGAGGDPAGSASTVSNSGFGGAGGGFANVGGNSAQGGGGGGGNGAGTSGAAGGISIYGGGGGGGGGSSAQGAGGVSIAGGVGGAGSAGAGSAGVQPGGGGGGAGGTSGTGGKGGPGMIRVWTIL